MNAEQIELDDGLSALSARQIYERFEEFRFDPERCRALRREVQRRWADARTPPRPTPDASIDERAAYEVLLRDGPSTARWAFWREAGASNEELEREIAHSLTVPGTMSLSGGEGFQVEYRGGSHPSLIISQGWMDEAPHRLSGSKLVQAVRSALGIAEPEEIPVEICTLMRVLPARQLLERLDAAALDSPERRAARAEIKRRVEREPDEYPEAPGEDEPLRERALWAALHHHPHARSLWSFWREAGATDEELADTIRAAAGEDNLHQQIPGAGWVEYRMGRVFYGETSSQKHKGSLQGRRLFEATRKMLGIALPAKEGEEPPLLTSDAPPKKKKKSTGRAKVPALGVQLSLEIG